MNPRIISPAIVGFTSIFLLGSLDSLYANINNYLSNNTFPASNENEALETLENILGYSIAGMIAAVVIPNPLNRPPIELDDEEEPDNTFQNNSPQGSILQTFNRHEKQLQNAGYDLETLDIPDEFLDPITQSLMVNPVTLLTPNPDHRHSFDQSTYDNYFLAWGITTCPFTYQTFSGYEHNDKLRLSIKAWVKSLVLESQNQEKLLISHYYDTFFAQVEKDTTPIQNTPPFNLNLA